MTCDDGFRPGDLVVHPAKPEWGSGVVQSAARATVNGKLGQRLVIRFANGGRRTINTAVAPLRFKDAQTAMTHTDTPSQGWLDALEKKRGGPDELYALPDSMTDPFRSTEQRLKATLESYRFSIHDPRALLDWAVIQTGLNDPLTKYTRIELEQAFPRFARDRDQHMRSLARQLRQSGKVAVIEQVGREVARIPAAVEALKRAVR